MRFRSGVFFVFAAIVASLSACGGEKDDDKKEEKRPVDYCFDACRQATDCPAAPEDYLEDCEGFCRDAARASNDAGCLDEFEAVARCGDRTFSCEGGEESACENESADLVACVTG